MVATDTAALVSQKIIGVFGSAENCAERMHEQEYCRQFNPEVNITPMQALVQQEHFFAPVLGGLVMHELIGEQVKPHRVLIAMQMVKQYLPTIKEILVVDSREAMLQPLQGDLRRIDESVNGHRVAIGKQVIDLSGRQLTKTCGIKGRAKR